MCYSLVKGLTNQPFPVRRDSRLARAGSNRPSSRQRQLATGTTDDRTGVRGDRRLLGEDLDGGWSVAVGVPCGVAVLCGDGRAMWRRGGGGCALGGEVASALVVAVCSDVAPSKVVVVPPHALRRLNRSAMSKTTATPPPIAVSSGQGGRPLGGWLPESSGQDGRGGGTGETVGEVGRSRGSGSMCATPRLMASLWTAHGRSRQRRVRKAAKSLRGSIWHFPSLSNYSNQVMTGAAS